MSIIDSKAGFLAVIVVTAWVFVLGFSYIRSWFDGVKRMFKR